MTDEFGPLFAGQDSAAKGQEVHTYGVLELNAAIEAALDAAFPTEFWIRGEIQGLARTKMRRHWYFELAEKDAGGDQIKSRISVALLAWNRSGVEREMRAAPGFELEDDLEVRIRCRVGYYAPWGKLQLIMVGIDPEFTLGQLAANRERILRALAAEGLLEKNAQIPLSPVPLRVGLVTSVGSAAYNDFIQEISRAEAGFHIQAIDARVQGAEMESTVLAALNHFAHTRPDVVVLIRGGGSRSDLAGFDSEAIARAIAQMPVPVFTGIGHEIDTSVADAVAHRSFKTPTACAAALVERVLEFVQEVEEVWSSIREHADASLEEQAAALQSHARQLDRSARATLRQRRSELEGVVSRTRRESTLTLRRQAEFFGRTARGIGSGARVRLARLQTGLDALAAGLAPARLSPRFLRRRTELDRLAARIPVAAQRRLSEDGRRLAAAADRVRALDPQRVLQRGYSLSLDADGNVVRSSQALAQGDRLQTRFADGAAWSRVESVERPTQEPERERGDVE